MPSSVQQALAANPRDPAAMAEAAKALKENPEMLKVAADMFEKMSPGKEVMHSACIRSHASSSMQRMCLFSHCNFINPY